MPTLNLKSVEGDIGVIVGRFQTPYLTQGHRDLIDTVRSLHPKFMIVLGTAKVIPTLNNPMNFPERFAMIQQSYPGTIVSSITDERSNHTWSRKLDEIIRNTFPFGKPVLYGSRDSFVPSYKGKFQTVELESANQFVSATQARKDSEHNVMTSDDFRSGICYAIANQYPRINPTVDAAVMKVVDGERSVLLIRKEEDGNLGWRFPGGFINPREFAARAARREVFEETSINVDECDYEWLDTAPIDDWRYAGQNQSILTSFFVFHLNDISANPTAADDADEVSYWSLDSNPPIVPEHQGLWKVLTDRFKGLT